MKKICLLFISFVFVTIVFSQKKSNYKLKINEYKIQCKGKPQKIKNIYFPHNRYGITPQIDISANDDNSYNIAWLDKATNKIKISKISEEHKLIEEITIDYIEETRNLAGFTSLPNSKEFVIGYSKNNKHGDKEFEWWITYCDSEGRKIFNKRIFGEKSSTEVNSHGKPTYGGSARIVYNKKAKKIFFYAAHSKKWSDNVRHQGGYVGNIDLDGNIKVYNSWFISHNFDQRLINVDDYVCAMYHGDAYPRALGMREFGKERYIGRLNFFNIKGKTGDNTTNAELGGIVGLNNKKYALTFATGEGKRNAALYIIENKNKKLTATKKKWFYGKNNTSLITPKIAIRDEGIILLAYHEYDKKTSPYSDRKNNHKTVFIETDFNGNELTEPMRYDSIKLQPMHDLLKLPNGNIIWVVAEETSKKYNFKVYEINKIENNKRFYENYSGDYQKVNFSDKKGGFLIADKNYKLNKDILYIGELLTKKGKRAYLSIKNNKEIFTINNVKYKLFVANKLNKKAKLQIQTHENIMFYLKKQFSKKEFKMELKKYYKKIDENRIFMILYHNKIYLYNREGKI